MTEDTSYQGEWLISDLVTQSEMSVLAGVGKSTVAMWRYRYNDFPTPIVAKKRNVNLWSAEEFMNWVDRHQKRARQKYDNQAFEDQLNA